MCLGRVMSEIGECNAIEVTEEEVQRSLSAHLRQFPGQEQALIDYYRQNPDAVAALRAPIFEEKVVDFISELAKIEEREVDADNLKAEEEGGDAPAKAKKKPAAKKSTTAKKTTAKKPAAKKAAAKGGTAKQKSKTAKAAEAG